MTTLEDIRQYLAREIAILQQQVETAKAEDNLIDLVERQANLIPLLRLKRWMERL